MIFARALGLTSLPLLAFVVVLVSACSGSTDSSIISTTTDGGGGGGTEGGSADGGSDAAFDAATTPTDCPTPDQCASGAAVTCSTPGAQCNVAGYVGVYCASDRNGNPIWLCAQGGSPVGQL